MNINDFLKFTPEFSKQYSIAEAYPEWSGLEASLSEVISKSLSNTAELLAHKLSTELAAQMSLLGDVKAVEHEDGVAVVINKNNALTEEAEKALSDILHKSLNDWTILREKFMEELHASTIDPSLYPVAEFVWFLEVSQIIERANTLLERAESTSKLKKIQEEIEKLDEEMGQHVDNEKWEEAAECCKRKSELKSEMAELVEKVIPNEMEKKSLKIEELKREAQLDM